MRWSWWPRPSRSVPGSPATATDRGSPRFDRNADGRSDFALLRATTPDAFTWFWLSFPGFAEDVFGNPSSDVPIVGDFDADGINDPAVVRRGSPNHWFVQLSGANGLVADVAFGDDALGDVPLTGDIDGDGRTDFVIFRPGSPATWFARSATGVYGNVAFGDTVGHNDTPALGDIDGDGRSDIIIRRKGDNDNSTFFHVRSARSGFLAPIHFGRIGDTYVPGDYNNDGVGEIAVVRTAAGSNRYRWFIRYSDTAVQTFTFGEKDRGDVLVQNDYDGNGYTDVAVWRPGDPGTLFIQPVPSGTVVQTSFGKEGDAPLGFWFNCFQNLATICAPT